MTLCTESVILAAVTVTLTSNCRTSLGMVSGESLSRSPEPRALRLPAWGQGHPRSPNASGHVPVTFPDACSESQQGPVATRPGPIKGSTGDD